MKELIEIAKKYSSQSSFYNIYSAYKEQLIGNISIPNPLLIVVLEGKKIIGNEIDYEVTEGNFLFLPAVQKINMRNIPSQNLYFAVLIEFEQDDFNFLLERKSSLNSYIKGDVDDILKISLKQFIEFSATAPSELVKNRRKEFLELLYDKGYIDIGSLTSLSTITLEVQKILETDLEYNWSADRVAKKLNLSESTLRRKLHLENNNFYEVKRKIRLNYGLFLIQTTYLDLGEISVKCGYQSQSRFTDQFKKLFGLTPTALRKTRMTN